MEFSLVFNVIAVLTAVYFVALIYTVVGTIAYEFFRNAHTIQALKLGHRTFDRRISDELWKTN